MIRLSLSFDDSRKDFYTNVLPLLVEHNIPATLNVISNRVERADNCDPNRRYMTVNEVLDSFSTGMVEIASHSANHLNDLNDIITSIGQINSWKSGICSGGFASPFSELSFSIAKEKGIWNLVENGTLKYIRSGTRTRREGLFYSGTQFLNRYLHQPFMFRKLNNRFIINQIVRPFFPSVAIHNDVTLRMLTSFIDTIAIDQAVVFCFHSILRSDEQGYGRKFCWDYDRFRNFLIFLKSRENINVLPTINLIQDDFNFGKRGL